MKRTAALTVVVLASSQSFAQTTLASPSGAALPVASSRLSSSAPADTASAGSSSSQGVELRTPAEWKIEYDEARAKLVTGEFADAASRFGELERTATNHSDRALAHAQGTLAAEWAARGLAFVQRSDLGESHVSAKAVDKRTTDELVSLYTNGVFYGLGSGIWLGTFTESTTAAGSILPTLALSGASVGAIAALDSGRGLRYGVAQSIVSGLYIGLEEGIVWSAYASSREGSKWTTKEPATVIWGASTFGALAGGVLGAIGTTPGRASWVGSSALWTGTVAGLATGALVGGNDGSQTALVAAGLGLTAGTGIGLASASGVSPSIARVRFLDLGGISGGLVVAGLYAAAANKDIDGRALAGTAALGVLAGLGAAWGLTSSMPEDRPRTGAVPETALARMRPMLMPASGGATLGIGGSLD